MKGRMVLDSVDRSIINRKITIQRVYNKKVIECISLNIRNSFIWRRCTRKLVHPRHMNSFRIFYDIHSITYKYITRQTLQKSLKCLHCIVHYSMQQYIVYYFCQILRGSASYKVHRIIDTSDILQSLIFTIVGSIQLLKHSD